MDRRKLALTAISIAVIPFVLGSYFWWIYINRLPTDFGVYYAGAFLLRFHPSANIYDWRAIQSAGTCGATKSPFVYPPLFAILFEPLVFLPCKIAAQVWVAISSSFLAGSLYLIGLIWPMRLRWYILLGYACCISIPTFSNMVNGQITFLVMFGLLLTWWLYVRGHPISAGIVLAITAMIQMSPGLLVVYFLLQRQWRIALSSIATGIALALIQLLLVGPRPLLQWVQGIHGTYAFNAPGRVFNPIYTVGPIAVTVVAVLFVVVAMRRCKQAEQGYFWAICMMIALSPVVPVFFVLWTFPQLISWWRSGPRWLSITAVALYLLTWTADWRFPILIIGGILTYDLIRAQYGSRAVAVLPVAYADSAS